MNKIPVLFLIYNRPETTREVFNTIKQYRPLELYIASDGPNENKFDDKKWVSNTIRITSEIGWKCRVKRLHRNKHLGCKKAVSGAINWFFDNIERGIVLEDDTLPEKSFFDFAQAMLSKYGNDEKIMHIGGNNFQPRKNKIPGGYYFSKYAHVWGWASWRRAWKYYSADLDGWEKKENQKKIAEHSTSFWEKHYWEAIFNAVYQGKIDTWDYQWLYSIWKKGGVSICPGVNLVRNIGFGKNATHTKKINDLIDIDSQKIQFPLKSPPRYVLKNIYDEYTTKNIFKASPKTVLYLKYKYGLKE